MPNTAAKGQQLQRQSCLMLLQNSQHSYKVKPSAASVSGAMLQQAPLAALHEQALLLHWSKWRLLMRNQH